MLLEEAVQIILDHSEGDREVEVIWKDDERFRLTVEQVIEACRAYDPKEKVRIRSAYDALLDKLGVWTFTHTSVIEHAFFTRRDGGFLFLIVTKSDSYDDAFEDELSDLDIEIASDDRFKGIDVGVMALPNCEPVEYVSFITPGFSLQFCTRDAA